MISIGNKQIDICDFKEILFNNQKVEISEETREKVEKCHKFLIEFSENKVIYGLNTGLGPMAQFKIETESQQQLQYNLVRSHSAGAGLPLPDIYAKASMLARLNTLSKGYSGIHSEVIDLLTSLINLDVIPYIPEHGGVGASGDLVQLAHLALNLIGEGEVNFENKLQPTNKVFKKLNLEPIKLRFREGLALINGTSVMTGIGIVNVIQARNLMGWTLAVSSIINEMVESYDDHFSSQLNSVKLHYGQQKIAEKMRWILSDSSLIHKRDTHLFSREVKETVIDKKVQEYYSLRCVPQILGPILETLDNAEKILIDESNSVNDNPIIDVENNNIYHGGNFHGDYVSLEMDKLKIAIAKMSMLSERQLNFLLNNKLNHILPPFANLGVLGLNLGMQGTQFTATSTVAENQMLSNPMYIHSIPNNNDNQDIVSMGTNSALIAKKVIENSFQVIAIELLTILQSVDYLKQYDKLSTFSKSLYDKLRPIVPTFVEDTAKYKDLNNIKEYIQKNPLNIL